MTKDGLLARVVTTDEAIILDLVDGNNEAYKLLRDKDARVQVIFEGDVNA